MNIIAFQCDASVSFCQTGNVRGSLHLHPESATNPEGNLATSSLTSSSTNNPSVLEGNPYYCNNPTDFPNSRRSNNCNDNNHSSSCIGSQQQQISDQYHRRSITTSNNTRRAHQPCSSLIGRVIIEENITGPVMNANADNDVREPVEALVAGGALLFTLNR